MKKLMTVVENNKVLNYYQSMFEEIFEDKYCSVEFPDDNTIVFQCDSQSFFGEYINRVFYLLDDNNIEYSEGGFFDLKSSELKYVYKIETVLSNDDEIDTKEVNVRFEYFIYLDTISELLADIINDYDC